MITLRKTDKPLHKMNRVELLHAATQCTAAAIATPIPNNEMHAMAGHMYDEYARRSSY